MALEDDDDIPETPIEGEVDDIEVEGDDELEVTVGDEQPPENEDEEGEEGDEEGQEGEDDVLQGEEGDDFSDAPPNWRDRLTREQRVKLRERERADAAEMRAAELENRLAALEVAEIERVKKQVETDLTSTTKEIEEKTKRLTLLRREADPENADEEVRLQAELAEAVARKRDLETRKANPPQPTVRKTEAGPSNPLAARWKARNWWFGKQGYEVESHAAALIDDQLAKEGYDPQTSRYFNELDRRLSRKIRIPTRSRGRGTDGQRSRSPVNPVRPAAGGGKKRVHLTRGDLETMRKLGLDPRNKEHTTEFARQRLLSERQSKRGG